MLKNKTFILGFIVVLSFIVFYKSSKEPQITEIQKIKKNVKIGKKQSKPSPVTVVADSIEKVAIKEDNEELIEKDTSSSYSVLLGVGEGEARLDMFSDQTLTGVFYLQMEALGQYIAIDVANGAGLLEDADMVINVAVSRIDVNKINLIFYGHRKNEDTTIFSIILTNHDPVADDFVLASREDNLDDSVRPDDYYTDRDGGDEVVDEPINLEDYQRDEYEPELRYDDYEDNYGY